MLINGACRFLSGGWGSILEAFCCPLIVILNRHLLSVKELSLENL